MVQLHAVADSGIPSNRHWTAPQWQEPWIISVTVSLCRAPLGRGPRNAPDPGWSRRYSLAHLSDELVIVMSRPSSAQRIDAQLRSQRCRASTGMARYAARRHRATGGRGWGVTGAA